MGSPPHDRLTANCRRLDRLATYGLPEPIRTHELIDRARTCDELRPIQPPRRLLEWKVRSTVAELGRRVIVESRNDPSTLPAAARMLMVSISTGVMSAPAAAPASALVSHQDETRLDVFVTAQGVVGLLVFWYVVALVRNPDHLPLRQVALPSALIGVCLVVQAFTNQPLVDSDRLYTASCLTMSIGSFGVALAAIGWIPDGWARGGLRLNAFGTVLAGVNVFDWVSRTYGAVSVASAIQVGMICLGFSGTVMLARLPFRRDVPETGPGIPIDAVPD